MTEVHLVEVTRATALDVLQPGTRFEAAPPERGRYEYTLSISVPEVNCKLIAVRRVEVGK